jgi:hypothetical protein
VKRVYVASPFRGTTREETRQNIIYARLCMLDSLERGEAPYLSHLLYTQVWSEQNRETGLRAGDAFREACDEMAVYGDLGITDGMQRAIDTFPRWVRGRKLQVNTLPPEFRTNDIVRATPTGWRRLLAMMPLEGFPELAP